jgi:hypothetical protein
LHGPVKALVGVATTAATALTWWKFGLSWGLVALLLCALLITTITGFRQQRTITAAAVHRSDLSVHVETDRGVIWAGAPPWTSYMFAVPSIDRLGNPPSGPCVEWWKWARSYGGVDVRDTEVRVTLIAATDRTVVINGLRPQIVKREPPPPWPVVLCAAAGGAELTYRGMHVDLDGFGTPTAHFVAQDGTQAQRPPVISVRAGEAEMFHITGHAEYEYIEWVAEVLLIVDGQRKTVTIDDDGEPFRTCGKDLRQWYRWHADEGWQVEERGGTG